MLHQMNLILKCLSDLSDSTRDSLRTYYDCTEGCVNFEEVTLLYCLAKYARTGCIVEVGSYRGRSTVFLARGSLDGAKISVYAVDPHKHFVGVLGGVFGPQDRTTFFQVMLDCGCSEIVSLINLSSEDFTSMWREPVALLWIDGDHRYEAVKRDFQCWKQHLAVDAIIALDDAADPSLGPRRLINELTKCEEYREILTIGKVSVLCKNTVGIGDDAR